MRLIDADALTDASCHGGVCAECDDMYGGNNVVTNCSEVRLRFLKLIKDAPTIEERKRGEWTTEQVAELLANLLRDECACNFNGIDEWLPSACKYSETDCPEPKEKHGCWMQFLMQGGADMRGGQDG